MACGAVRPQGWGANSPPQVRAGGGWACVVFVRGDSAHDGHGQRLEWSVAKHLHSDLLGGAEYLCLSSAPTESQLLRSDDACDRVTGRIRLQGVASHGDFLG